VLLCHRPPPIKVAAERLFERTHEGGPQRARWVHPLLLQAQPKNRRGADQEETKATVRCIPLAQPGTPGKDFFTGEETGTHVLFAQNMSGGD